MVWSDNRNGDGDVYGIRVDANGNPIDQQAFPIATGKSDQHPLDIASKGSRSLVVTNAGATFAGADGKVGVTLAIGGDHVVPLGKGFLVVELLFLRLEDLGVAGGRTGRSQLAQPGSRGADLASWRWLPEPPPEVLGPDADAL